MGFTGASVFFFFQAEDGIRDRDVTGVQTCALPILPRSAAVACTRGWARPPPPRRCGRRPPFFRSEERRVGKECRAPGPQHDKKQKEIAAAGQLLLPQEGERADEQSIARDAQILLRW